MAWSAIGAALLAVGVAAGGVLATLAASSHLWGRCPFLLGFFTACLLAALGVYVLIAEFFGFLPLPPTRYERTSQAKTPATEGQSLSEALAAAAKTVERLHSDAGELDPTGNAYGVEELIDRCNVLDRDVAAALAAHDEAGWRDTWVSQCDYRKLPSQITNTSEARDVLNLTRRAVSHRRGLIDDLRRALRLRDQP